MSDEEQVDGRAEAEIAAIKVELTRDCVFHFFGGRTARWPLFSFVQVLRGSFEVSGCPLLAQEGSAMSGCLICNPYTPFAMTTAMTTIYHGRLHSASACEILA